MGNERKTETREDGAASSSTLFVSVSLSWTLVRMTKETKKEGDDEDRSNGEKEDEEEEGDS